MNLAACFRSAATYNLSAFGLALVLLAAPLSAHALADDEARRAILELRQQTQQMATQIQQMRAQYDQSVQARIQLADQIEILRGEVTSLRGKIEQIDWQVQQLARSNQANTTASEVDPIEASSFEGAMEQFRAGLYTEAASSFNRFIDAYPGSTLAQQAQFYRGSSLYAAREFQAAIETLQALVQANPDDTRAPDALLIIAASHIELNALEHARTALQSIVQNYPQSQVANTATERLKLLR